MKPILKFLLAAAAGAATWGAQAATERIVCEAHPGASAMTDCILLSPATSGAQAGGTPASPDAVTYYVVEPGPAGSAAGASRAAAPEDAAGANLDQPPADALPYPYPSNEPGEHALIVYVVDRDDVQAASRGEREAIPAQRLIITQPDPPLHVD